MKLHVGGISPHPEWMILNVQAGPHVDFVGDIRDLGQFDDGAAEAIYASHVLEHVPLAEVDPVLKGMHRVLAAGGSLYLSVPDLEVLCRLFLHPQATAELKRHVMGMMFGGQVDPHDFHYVGFYESLLRRCLVAAGFVEIRRVASFGLFADTSDYRPYGVAISLNLLARK